ncbi:MAG: winged helix-turn-helix transcriptional regulator, partial [Acidimicrobiales bacterium]|nr:winged helix-turn-helix transcriptional regulator [Acidimicrobiales bacterium]
MSESAPALVPLFRSEQQLRLLDVLFDRAEDELSIGELADRAGVAHATASREVGRLAKHGIVVTRALGRNTLVAANWELPWAVELRSLLAKTIGVLGRVAEALAGIDGVAEAYVFGSWASRYVGAAGPFPRDVDLLVIGAAPLREIRR